MDTNDKLLLELTYSLADRINRSPELLDMGFDLISDMNSWVESNEPTIGLQLLADRLFDNEIEISIEEYEMIVLCRKSYGLPDSKRFEALTLLISRE